MPQSSLLFVPPSLQHYLKRLGCFLSSVRDLDAVNCVFWKFELQHTLNIVRQDCCGLFSGCSVALVHKNIIFFQIKHRLQKNTWNCENCSFPDGPLVGGVAQQHTHAHRRFLSPSGESWSPLTRKWRMEHLENPQTLNSQKPSGSESVVAMETDR